VKAIRVQDWGGPEVLRLEDVPEPVPGPGQVVVRAHAIGVNPVDTYIRSGIYGKDRPLPYTPGSDAAGEVLAVGEGVAGLEPGTRVYTSGAVSGAYAEQVLCDAGQVHPLPDNASFAQGAALGVPYVTAYRSLFQRARAVPGETVLVHGASGGVGTAALQFGRAAGMRMIGTAGSEEGRRLVLEQGAERALDHGVEGYLEGVMELTGGRGVDVILEMLANVNLGRDLTVLAPGGRVAVVGNRGTVEINPRETMRREADIRGVMLVNATEKEMQACHAAIRAGLENGTLKPFIGEEIPLAEAARAHESVINAAHHGKIILTVD